MSVINHLFHSALQVSKMACVEGGAVAKGEMKVASMVILMVLSFLVSWLPYASLAMFVVSRPHARIHPLVGTLPVYLAKSSTAYNPIIYILLNKQVIYSHTLIILTIRLRNVNQFNDLGCFLDSHQPHLVVITHITHRRPVREIICFRCIFI